MRFFIYLFALVVSAMSESNLELLKTGNDQFTATMLQEVIKENPGGSVVLSAFSVLSSLAQLCLASVGKSHDEILKAIGFPDDDVIKEQFTNVTNNLQSLQGIELNLANKDYYRKGETLLKKFTTVSKDVFNSEVQSLNFSKNVDAARKINIWVENNTNNCIKDLMSPDLLDASTTAVLVNAIYFKGKWTNTFDPFRSWETYFYVNKDESIKIRTMQQQDNFKYGESEELDAKLLEMTYEGDQSSLLAILPNKNNGIKALVKKLKDPSIVSKAVEDMQYYEVAVQLPSFEIETSIDLQKILKNMNVTKLFKSSEARLHNMFKGKPDMSITAAVHKAYIAVNEDGSEASAANALTMGVGMSAGENFNPNLKYFTADHPFYFALQIDNIITFNGIFVK